MIQPTVHLTSDASCFKLRFWVILLKKVAEEASEIPGSQSYSLWLRGETVPQTKIEYVCAIKITNTVLNKTKTV